MTAELRGVEGLSCHPNGQVTLSGPLLALERGLDRLFLAWAEREGAVEHRFPPVVPARELDRVDYFRSFPHLATFPVSLPRDEARLRAFAGACPVAADGAVCLAGVDPVREVLTPAACYPVYVHHRGARLGAPALLTTRATCFRREDRFEPLARQWAFTMREIVCLGGRDETVAFVERQRRRAGALARALGLPLGLEPASDPFFDAPRSAKRLFQRLAPAKEEIVFDGRLAIGSINFHRSYFGEAFAIERDGRPAFSACVAFGIERWILAILERFGPRVEGWPDLEECHGL